MPTYAPFPTPLLCAQWEVPFVPPGTQPPPAGAPIRTLPCAARKPSVAEATAYAHSYGVSIDLVIGFAPRPAGSPTRYFSTYDGEAGVGQNPVQTTVFELPPGSQQFWYVVRSVVVARSYVNEHKLCYCTKAFLITGTEKL